MEDRENDNLQEDAKLLHHQNSDLMRRQSCGSTYSEKSVINNYCASPATPINVKPPDVHLSLIRKLCYSVGHVLNDVVASMWFTYLLIFLHVIINFDPVLAGYLMLLGQVVDGVCTPLIGYESDRSKGCCRLGRRKSWYLVGTLCVLVSFPFIFNKAIDGKNNHPGYVLFIYYAPFVAIFQFGWAATQISHLSLIPDLTHIENERIELNAYRYACTVLANITVFSVAWVLLAVHHISSDDPSAMSTFDTLQPSDSKRFMLLVFSVMGIGLIFVITFFIGTKEKPDNLDTELSTKTLDSTLNKYGVAKLDMRWTCWLKESQFYKVAFLYMCSCLYTNINQVYLPMYLLYSLNMTKQSIAIIPLIVFAAGFVATVLMKIVSRVLGPKVTYFISLLIGVCGCVYIWFIHSGSKYIYIVACLIGFGGSTMLVTALALTAKLISCNTETGAFVYGAMSFTDKITNGIVIVIIQHLHPQLQLMCHDCAVFYKYVMVFVPAGSMVIALLALLSLGRQEIGLRREHRKLLKQQRKLSSSQPAIITNVNCDDYSASLS